MTLVCRSRVRQVTVHARGALVTRSLTLPALPDADVELVVPDVTALADPEANAPEVDKGFQLEAEW